MVDSESPNTRNMFRGFTIRCSRLDRNCGGWQDAVSMGWEPYPNTPVKVMGKMNRASPARVASRNVEPVFCVDGWRMFA